MDTDEIAAEMQRAAADFRSLLDTATSADLRRGSDGTKWTNEQLLFHMLFGYLVVRNLRVLVWVFGRLPDGFSRAFAALLNNGTRPFHTINYLGSLGGARVLGHTPDGAHLRSRRGRTHRLHAPPERGEPGPGHALPDRLGPVLPRLHDHGRRLPLRHPALRSPSSAAHPPRRRRIIRPNLGPLAARQALRSPGPVSKVAPTDLVRGARTSLEQVGYPRSVWA